MSGVLFLLISALFALASPSECERQIEILADRLENSTDPAMYEALAEAAARIEASLGPIQAPAPQYPVPPLTSETLHEVTTDDLNLEDRDARIHLGRAALAWAEAERSHYFEPGGIIVRFLIERASNRQKMSISLLHGFLFVKANPHLFLDSRLITFDQFDQPVFDYDFDLGTARHGDLIPLLANSKKVIRESIWKADIPLLDFALKNFSNLDISDLDVFKPRFLKVLSPSTLRLLIKHGADPSKYESDFIPNALFCLDRECPIEHFEILTEAGASAAAVNRFGSLLQHERFTLEQMRFLIKNGAPLEAQDSVGHTFLGSLLIGLLFEKFENVPIIELIVDSGADFYNNARGIDNLDYLLRSYEMHKGKPGFDEKAVERVLAKVGHPVKQAGSSHLRRDMNRFRGMRP